MAKRGRKPKTNEQKRASGERRPSRMGAQVVEFPAAKSVPECPAWVSYEEGQALWDEIAPMLFAQRVLTVADVYALAHLCQHHGELIDQYRRGNTPKPSDRSELRREFSEFGLTPASRARVEKGGEGSKNPFARHGRKPQKN